MNTTMYNNPVFASNLAGVVDQVLGDPTNTAYQEQAIANAALANDTAGYRANIGTYGRDKDLANMLLSSLQAGDEYSDNAPLIASSMASTAGFGYTPQQMANLQVGTGTQKAQDTFPGLSMKLNNARGGGGGGSRGSTSVNGSTLALPVPKSFGAGQQNAFVKMFTDPDGQYGGTTQQAFEVLAEAQRVAANGGTPESALAQVLDQIEIGEEVVKEGGWFSADETAPTIVMPWKDAPTDVIVNDIVGADIATDVTQDIGRDPAKDDVGAAIDAAAGTAPGEAPEAPAGPSRQEQMLQDARDAIARGASPKAVYERLQLHGINPALL